MKKKEPIKQRKELYLLANPTSGRGTTVAVANTVLRILRAQGWKVHPYRCKSPSATEEFMSRLYPDSVIVALGGDGFIRNIAKGCIKHGHIMAPLPAGRGNDLCRYLKISTNPAQAALELSMAKEQLLDVGYANGEPFLGTACMGFDGYANKVANEAIYIKSNLVYVWGAIKTLITYRPIHLKIQTIHETLCQKLYMVDVCNSGRYGGGIIASPTAATNDGLLDLVVWQPVNRLRFISLVNKAFKGTHVQAKEVKQSKVPWVIIGTTKKSAPIPVFADGDHLTDLPAKFTIKMGQLRVLA